MRGWPEKHPNWKYRLWGAADGRALIAEHYPHFVSTYDSYPDDVQRVDALRYFILHRFGGVYIDADIEPLGLPLDTLLKWTQGDASLLLPLEPREHAHAWCTKIMVGMSFIGSVPGHPFWIQLHRELEERAHLPVLYSTGPLMLSDVVSYVLVLVSLCFAWPSLIVMLVLESARVTISL